jgi:hypothetical protein
MVARVTPWSQQYRLRQQFERSHVRHNETVRVDIRGVRVMSRAGHGPMVSFSDVEPLHIRRRLTSGDDGPMPESVEMQGFDFPGDGLFDLEDVVVHCNGDLRISADARTHVEPHREEQSILDRFSMTLTW